MMELVRCRMCGGQATPTRHVLIFADDVITYSCYCERCNTQIGMFGTRQEVIEFWNKLMAVTLDDLSGFCDQHECECPIYIAEPNFNDRYCLTRRYLNHKDKIEKEIQLRRDGQNEQNDFGWEAYKRSRGQIHTNR